MEKQCTLRPPTSSPLLLRTYITSEVIDKTESKNLCFTKLSKMMACHDDENLATKTFCCGNMIEDYAQNKIFIKGVDASIRNSMPDYRMQKWCQPEPA